MTTFYDETNIKLSIGRVMLEVILFPIDFNSFTDEEFNNEKNSSQRILDKFLDMHPEIIEGTLEDIKINGQRALVTTLYRKTNGEMNIQKNFLFMIYNQRNIIIIDYSPENKEAVKTVEQIQNSIRFSK